jgi:uncharacterized protein YgbK (DUF1537 family)
MVLNYTQYNTEDTEIKARVFQKETLEVTLIKLLVIADDFTGALDTGVKFAKEGVDVQVTSDRAFHFDRDEVIEVLVINTETRHLNKEEAYRVIYDITKRALDFKVSYIYKKTDSALRGNIGSELSAMIDASEEKMIAFIPAFPQMKRYTRAGTQYIEGVAVHKSIFGKDPFDPVLHSYIPDIIRQQSEIDTKVIGAEETREELKDFKGIAIYNADSFEKLEEIGQELKKNGYLHMTAGCAGFAELLPGLFEMKKGVKPEIKYHSSFLVACGSINPITKKQLEIAQRNGFYRINLTKQQKLNKAYWETKAGQASLKKMINCCKAYPYCMIDTIDLGDRGNSGQNMIKRLKEREEIRKTIADNLGYLLKCIMDAGYEGNMLITGGDILQGFMKELGVTELFPLKEIKPGVVISKFYWKEKDYQIVSKSGGFGEHNLILELSDEFKKAGSNL